MRVAAVQHDIVWADREANFARLAPLISRAADEGARLAVLTEMFSTGFVVDRDDIGEPTGGPSSSFLSDMAARHGIWVAGSCPETAPDDPRPYNSLVVASPDGTQHRYSKIHPFTYGGEDRHFRPGSKHVTVDIEGTRTSLFVCYDLRFADEFWGLARDTDLYVVPANWPESRRTHWVSLLRARAIENQAYVVGVNRVGDGGGLAYCGDSRIIDPLGNETVAADGESIACAEVSPQNVAEVRARFPFLQDRRS
ncbi:MAG: carbon-nitrogen family hydrolase [Actinobacteria bacterium]|jgi:predicted amidohydrolase|nr:carbon-nitrogen family hydrolase [Actinomycetota bacterium]NBR66001.1 carbon-nitrogen family hydrolase [Actinomycetota bacterium]NBU16213.1 carbon-nitrogen family hydrolase [Actinomycetota bacterium]